MMNIRELEAARASLVASLASLDVAIARARESSATSSCVALDEATAALGSKRRAREFFAKAERAGFRVLRVGHSVSMDRDEWTRALDALASKRQAKPPKKSDEGPAEALARAGNSPRRAA